MKRSYPISQIPAADLLGTLARELKIFSTQFVDWRHFEAWAKSQHQSAREVGGTATTTTSSHLRDAVGPEQLRSLEFGVCGKRACEPVIALRAGQ
jgi:hypothetical protein